MINKNEYLDVLNLVTSIFNKSKNNPFSCCKSGMNADEINFKLVCSEGFKFSEDIKCFLEIIYSWCGGFDYSSCCSIEQAIIFPYYYMLPIEESLNRISEIYGYPGLWLPIFTDGSSAGVYVDINSSEIIKMLISIPDLPMCNTLINDSIIYFRCMADCFVKKAYVIKKTGVDIANTDIEDMIFKKYGLL